MTMVILHSLIKKQRVTSNQDEDLTNELLGIKRQNLSSSGS